MAVEQPKCLYCNKTNEEVPLIPLIYQAGQTWICPQHLPILIHKPGQLAGKLPGAENLGEAEGHDHE